jgi:hypothetical protein
MDFTNFATVNDWTTALEQLIADSVVAIQNDNHLQINQLQTDLLDFQDQSPTKFDSLDAIAFKISLELNRASRTAALRNLENLRQELRNLNSMLEVATNHAIEAADSIHLKNTKDFLGKAKTSLTILKGLRDDLADNTTNLGRKIQAVVQAINDFEAAFPT